VDTGSNPGAIGIDYMANNKGVIRDVTIRGQGSALVFLVRAWPGPCFKNVRVEGFILHRLPLIFQYGVTFEQITLASQSALVLLIICPSIRGLTSNNSVPVIRVEVWFDLHCSVATLVVVHLPVPRQHRCVVYTQYYDYRL